MNTTGTVTQQTFNKEVEAHKLREEFEVEPVFQLITFDAALITANTIDMDINGTALAQVTFATDNDTTLEAIATLLQALSSIVTATRTTTRIIKIVPVAQFGADDFGVGGADFVDIDNVLVLAGGSQAVANVTKTESLIRPGMPVEQDPTSGKIIPLTNDAELEYIGIALHSSKGGELVTVAMRGYAVIVGIADGSLNYGPVTWDSYDEALKRNKYNNTSVNASNFAGWTLDNAANLNDEIRVVVRG